VPDQSPETCTNRGAAESREDKGVFAGFGRPGRLLRQSDGTRKIKGYWAGGRSFASCNVVGDGNSGCRASGGAERGAQRSACSPLARLSQMRASGGD
jgi:hypothetical protein